MQRRPCCSSDFRQVRVVPRLAAAMDVSTDRMSKPSRPARQPALRTRFSTAARQLICGFEASCQTLGVHHTEGLTYLLGVAGRQIEVMALKRDISHIIKTTYSIPARRNRLCWSSYPAWQIGSRTPNIVPIATFRDKKRPPAVQLSLTLVNHHVEWIEGSSCDDPTACAYLLL